MEARTVARRAANAFIFLKKWDELAETLRALLAAPSAELERRQQAMLEWRDHLHCERVRMVDLTLKRRLTMLLVLRARRCSQTQ